MPYSNILLIDDDEEDHEIFCAALRRISVALQCTTLANAKVALDKLAAKDLTPDVIFLDLNMAVMSGQDFLQERMTRKSMRDIPIIIYSTSSNPATIKLTKELGAIGFITKPDKFSTLIDILKPIFI